MPQTRDIEERADTDIYGICALSLLEAIILILREKSLITEDELDDAFDAAINAHKSRHAQHTDEKNQVAATLLDRLRVHGNSVRLDGSQ